MHVMGCVVGRHHLNVRGGSRGVNGKGSGVSCGRLAPCYMPLGKPTAADERDSIARTLPKWCASVRPKLPNGQKRVAHRGYAANVGERVVEELVV
eukprot:6175275-Pleurochrysis_carterae.AAC.2